MTLARQQLAAAATGKQAAGERRRELKLEVQLQVHAAKKVAPLKILLIKGRDSENCSQTTRFSLCKMLFAIKRFLILIRGQSEIYFTQRGCRCRVMKTKSKKKVQSSTLKMKRCKKRKRGQRSRNAPHWKVNIFSLSSRNYRAKKKINCSSVDDDEIRAVDRRSIICLSIPLSSRRLLHSPKNRQTRRKRQQHMWPTPHG